MTSSEQVEDKWRAAKAGMWDSVVDLAQGLLTGPQLSLGRWSPPKSFIDQSSLLNWAKVGPPAPTGDPDRDAQLLDNYKAGGWVTTTISLAAPFAAEGLLSSASSAARKLPALDGIGMGGGGRLIGPTEQWLSRFPETSGTPGPELSSSLSSEVSGSLPQFGEQNFTHVFRGGSGDRGIGVLHIDKSTLSNADIESTFYTIQDMDFQAGMAGGLERTDVQNATVQLGSKTVPSRSVANSTAALGRRALSLNKSEHAGHIGDVASGGSPLGPIMGQPASINSSIGGQWGRYAPGFTFEGFSLVDRATGEFIYTSHALENEPAAFLDLEF